MPDFALATRPTETIACSEINTSTAGTIGAIISGVISLRDLDDVALRNCIANVKLFKNTSNELAGEVVRWILAEFTKRMLANNQTTIPDAELEIKLVEEFSEYTYDVEALCEAAKLLPPDEAAKVVRYVPEQIIPAHYVEGHPVSIATLQKAYANTAIGKHLAKGMKRASLGKTTTVKPRKPSKKAHPIRNAA